MTMISTAAEARYVAPYWRELTPRACRWRGGQRLYRWTGRRGGLGSGFYELETLSPAMPLQSGESALHRNRVFHIRGDHTSIETIVRRFLRTDFTLMQEFFDGLR
ncbi:MAG: DUF6786 family protein [Terriglobia bacterium]